MMLEDTAMTSSNVGTTKRRKTPMAGGASAATGTSSTSQSSPPTILPATTTLLATQSAPSSGNHTSHHAKNTTTRNSRKASTSHSFSGSLTASRSTLTTTTTSSSSGPMSSIDLSNRVMEDLHKEQSVLRATVRRRWFGTGPFDYMWLNLDCCGLLCAAFTYSLHLYSLYAVTWVLLPPWMSVTLVTATGESVRHLTSVGLFHEALFVSIAGLAIYSHFKTMTTNPGAVPPDAKPLPEEEPEDADEEDAFVNAGSRTNGEDALLDHVPLTRKQPRNLRLCRRCKAFKPPRAHHCSICKRCIIKMDHHCPWVNNCVAIGNHKYFLLFVFYTFVNCTYSMLLVIFRFSSCVHSSRSHLYHRHGHYDHAMQAANASAAVHAEALHSPPPSCVDHPSQLLTVLLLLIESLLFGIFTSCMMFDQMEVVQHKMTHIDRLKGIEVGGSLSGLAEVFGLSKEGRSNKKGRRHHNLMANKFRLDWLSPFVHGACFPTPVRDEVMGFCTSSSSASLARLEQTCCSTASCGTNTTTKPNKRSVVPDIV